MSLLAHVVEARGSNLGLWLSVLHLSELYIDIEVDRVKSESFSGSMEEHLPGHGTSVERLPRIDVNK